MEETRRQLLILETFLGLSRQPRVASMRSNRMGHKLSTEGNRLLRNSRVLRTKLNQRRKNLRLLEWLRRSLKLLVWHRSSHRLLIWHRKNHKTIMMNGQMNRHSHKKSHMMVSMMNGQMMVRNNIQKKSEQYNGILCQG